jgi:hypothetical protein
MSGVVRGRVALGATHRPVQWSNWPRSSAPGCSGAARNGSSPTADRRCCGHQSPAGYCSWDTSTRCGRPGRSPAGHGRGAPGTPSAHPGCSTPRPARSRLSLAALPVIRAGTAVYGLASVDSRGRVTDKAIPRALGWSPGTRLDIRASGGLLIVHACPDGVFAVTNQGYLGLPAPVRRWYGFPANDRVFLVAEPDDTRLVVYSPAALDAMVATSSHRSEVPCEL